MPDSEENIDPANVAVLDHLYLKHWEASLGPEEMAVFIQDLIAEFRTTYGAKLQEVRTHKSPDAEEALIPLVHYLKGSLGNLGLARASAFARQAEVELRTDCFSRHATFALRLDEYVEQGLCELEQRYR